MKVLSDALDVTIRIDAATREMGEADLNKLVQSHFLIQQARDDFLSGRLKWWEYIELVESHNVNVDSYLATVENNLSNIGIIV